MFPVYNWHVNRLLSKKNLKFVLTILKLVISVSLLYFIFKDTDLNYLFKQISQASPLGLLSYLLLSFFLIFLASYRWSLFLLDAPKPRDILHFYKANMIALFYNLFLPTAYGGDLVKWTHLGSFQFNKKTLIFSVFADRVIGVMGLITVGFFASLIVQLYNLPQVPTSISLLFLILFLGLVVVLVIIFTSIRFSRIPFLQRLTLLTELENYLFSRKKRFLEMYILAVIIQILSFTSFYLLALEAQLTIPFIYFLIISPIVSLISVLPISVAGFGTTETAYLYFFTQLGGLKGNILVFMSLFGIFKIILGVIGWITELIITSKSLTRVTIKD